MKARYGWGAGAALALSLGAMVVWHRQGPSAATAGFDGCEKHAVARLGGEPGFERSYRLDYAAAVCGEGECASLVTLRGELIAQALDRTDSGDEQVLITLRSESPASEIQDALPSVESLAAPVYVTLSQHGAIQTLRLGKQVDTPTQRLIESVLRELQVHTPECTSVKSEWSAQELLVGARVMSHFHADPSRRDLRWSRKQILEWTEAESILPLRGRASELKASQHRALLDAAGHIERVSGRDELVLELGEGEGQLTLRTTIELSPLGTAKRVTTDAARLASAELFTNPSSHSQVADDARISGHSVKSVLAELTRVKSVESPGGPSRSRLFVAASALLRRDDLAADEAAALIRAGHPESEFLMSALGDAGTSHSATLLADVLRGASNDQRATQALLALGRARIADTAVVETMAAELDDPRQSGTAQLMLGALAARTRDDSPEASAHATKTLLDSYDSAETVLARADALRGLGNAGSTEGLEIARRASSSANPIERAAAAQALRRIPSDVADRLLSTLMEDEADTVRRSAFDAALYRDPTDIVLRVVERSARLETSASVRREAIRVLVRWKSHVTSARRSLVWVSQNDPEQDLRQIAAEGLTRPAR